MTSKRIQEIQKETAYPNSVSVQQALLKVWNECQQEFNAAQAGEVSQQRELLRGLKKNHIHNFGNTPISIEELDDYINSL